MSYNDENYNSELFDLDGDGIADRVINVQHIGNNGTFDIQTETDLATNYVMAVEYLTDEYMDFWNDTFENYYDNYDGDGTGVVGDITDTDNWEFRGPTKACALYAQRSMIEALTGEDIDINEFIELAVENGVYDGSGTTICNCDAMLEEYGLDIDSGFNNTIDDIADCLENGGKVLVVIDSNEIWAPYDSTAFLSNAPNHALQVVGINYSNPEQPTVILNDSGVPYGQGLEVPLDDFMQAWQDSDCYMVEAYEA